MHKLPSLIDVDRELCARSFAEFVKSAWHVIEPAQDLKWGWALDAMCEHLEAVHDGDIQNLVIAVPPGMMKSLMVGVMFPAWEWGPMGRADLRYLGTAHKLDLAIRDNMKCRRLIQSSWYQERWPVVLTGDQNAKTKFENDQTGFREAMAFTSLTGSRGDRGLIDDPLSVNSANSDAEIESVATTFTESLPTRVNNDKSAFIVIMQRLHERDPVGIIMSHGLPYEKLILPMEFEPTRRCMTSIGFTDPRQVDGELLFPERFGREQVETLKRTMGSYAVASQFQQRPAPRGGSILQRDWWQIWAKKSAKTGKIMSPPCDYIMSSWDTAFSEKDTANYSVRTDWGIFQPEEGGSYAAILLGHWRERVSFPELKRTVIESYADLKPDFLLIENKASGISLIQELRMSNIRIHAIDPGRLDKVARAHAVSAMLEGGLVYVPGKEDAEGNIIPVSWAQRVIDACATFPKGEDKDTVDTCTQAWSELRKMDFIRPGDEIEEEEEFYERRPKEAIYG